MALDVIVGLQRGDEGKGRFVDLAAPNYEIVARGNGGANAGHTVVVEGMEPIALHQVPSGIIYPGKLNVIGNGVYLDPIKMLVELETLKRAGVEVTPDNLLISNMAHLVMPHHKHLDELREGGETAQGSTKSGIAFVASDKYLREGRRLEDVYDIEMLKDVALAGLSITSIGSMARRAELRNEVVRWARAVEALKPFMADTVEVINEKLDEGRDVLAEGAQAYWLDINHGMYPMVTSSSTTVNGLMDGLGVSHKHIRKVTGVAKVVTSHVGGGPFVTEITDPNLVQQLRGEVGKPDSEFGASTGRPRRVGYPDMVQLRNAVRGNGVDELVLSKMDHAERFGRRIRVATSYVMGDVQLDYAPKSAASLAECEPRYSTLRTWNNISAASDYYDLSMEAKQFVQLVEDEAGVQVGMLGVGYQRNQVVRL